MADKAPMIAPVFSYDEIIMLCASLEMLTKFDPEVSKDATFMAVAVIVKGCAVEYAERYPEAAEETRKRLEMRRRFHDDPLTGD